ncbi:hypothetical protein Golax_009728, partial [Gossypium laxum]|nr:hypothetical protein [Gossypium laxum]
MKENSLLNVVDPMVMNSNAKEEVVAVAKLAKRCLNFKGKKRPTMKQVALELEWIRSSEEANAIQQSADEDSNTDEMTEALGVASFSTSCSVVKDSCMLHVETGETVGEVKPVSNMHQRKEAMANHFDCFIALPGGYETLEELLEVIAWVQLGFHDKP